MRWREAVVRAGTPIVDAIQLMDSSAILIALVVDSDGRLVGTVTDGDVRRGILRGIDLKDSVDKIMNSNPVTATPENSRPEILALMKEKGIKQIPVVDGQRQIVGLEMLHDIHGRLVRDNPVVLMAGGLGRRLFPLTQHCPKPLLKVGSKPVLELILERFVSAGFHQFYFSVNYMAEMIEAHFGDGSNWDVNIHYLRENKSLGTAGALGLLPDRITSPVIVMNGDLITKLDFSRLLDFHEEQKASATMCVREYDFQVPYGVVSVDDHLIKGIEEKPVHKFFVNGGIYVLNPEVVRQVPKDTFYNMTTLFEGLLAEGMRPAAYPLREYWLDIGQHNDYQRAEDEFREVFRD